MKILMVAFLILALVGCGPNDEARQYDWVVERHGRPAADIQSDFDGMARNGWKVNDDNDLERTGFYVYFYQYLRPSVAQSVLQATADAVKGGRQVR
jgi:hypothetical protein